MNPFKTIFKHQHWHLLAVLILLVVLWKFATSDLTFLSGSLWGMSTFEWFLIAVAVPILHQVYVLIIWRLELHFKGFTKLLGRRAFKLYKFGFGLFMISRLASVFILAISNANSIQLSLALSIVLLCSKAAISVALFSHIYIWVHYYCTELPDMKEIYKQE